jgi:hypothetical protein
MTIKEYPLEELAGQPIGYWSGAANEIIVGISVPPSPRKT